MDGRVERRTNTTTAITTSSNHSGATTTHRTTNVVTPHKPNHPPPLHTHSKHNRRSSSSTTTTAIESPASIRTAATSSPEFSHATDDHETVLRTSMTMPSSSTSSSLSFSQQQHQSTISATSSAASLMLQSPRRTQRDVPTITPPSNNENNNDNPKSSDNHPQQQPQPQGNYSNGTNTSTDEDEIMESTSETTWMRILPFEEGKPKNDGKTSSSATPPLRKARTSDPQRRQVPSIVHAGGQVVPALVQRMEENPFEEYEEEDDLMLMTSGSGGGRYVRNIPLAPPNPLLPSRHHSNNNNDDDDDADERELEEFMPITPTASQSLPNNDDAFSQTIVAGNLIMTSSVLLLSSVVNLSVLKHSDTFLLQATHNDGNNQNGFTIRAAPPPSGGGAMADPQKFLFAPPAAKTVRDSLQRHFAFHLARAGKQPAHPPLAAEDEISFHVPDIHRTPPRLTPASPVSEEEEESYATGLSQQPLTPSTVHTVVNDCLKANNVGAAVAVYQAYLAKQNDMQKHGEHQYPPSLKSPVSSFSTPERCHSYHSIVSQSVVDDMDAQRADTLGKLAVLSLFAGQNKESMQYAMEAARIHKETSHRPLSTAMATMQVGMIHFATSRAGRALKAWREAMQLCCLAVGYDHPIVAVLLNNIGVLHYDSGDSLASIRALEESLGLQRSMLKSGLAAVHVDHALYQMATTMGNLALALELNERYDRAIALLQEAHALFESIDTTEDGGEESLEAADIVLENLERLFLLREKFLARGRNEQSLLHSESNSMGDASTTDGDRSVTLFGNPDGIPIKNGQVPLMTMADNHDYLLLGLVSKELTPRQRVREIVLTWFGRSSEDAEVGSVVLERTPFVPFDNSHSDGDEKLITPKPSEADRSSTVGQPTSPTRKKQELVVDTDTESVLNAELNLHQIHIQALEHLDHHEIGDALDLFVSALKSHKMKYGEEHHLVGTALHNIGMVHLFAEEYLQAYGIFKEAARIRSIALGPEHPEVAASTVKIGLLQYAAMDIAAALRTFTEVREIYLASMGYGHPHLAKIMNNIAVLRYEEGDFAGATRAFEIAYEYQRRLVEDNPGDSAAAEIAMGYTLANIGFLYHRQDELVSAVRLFEEARSTLMRHLFADDPKVVMVQQNIEYLVGKGVDMGAPCEEGCQLTPAAKTCLMQFSWR